MAYVFLDESGDLGFNLDRGSSRFFIVTALFAPSKRPLERIARDVYRGLRKRYPHAGTLHAYSALAATRRRLLQKVGDAQCAILAVILNKHRVPPRLQDEKANLYNHVANVLIDRILRRPPFPSVQGVTLIAARRETNRFLNENFRDYISQEADAQHRVRLAVQIASPASEKALQVADFVSWALFRKHEHNDSTCADLVREKIIGESWLFGAEETQSPATFDEPP